MVSLMLRPLKYYEHTQRCGGTIVFYSQWVVHVPFQISELLTRSLSVIQEPGRNSFWPFSSGDVPDTRRKRIIWCLFPLHSCFFDERDPVSEDETYMFVSLI